MTLPSTHPSAPLEARPRLVDQRIHHIFFRAGDEDQQVISNRLRLPAMPSTAPIPLITEP